MTRGERPQLAGYRPAEPTATCGHQDHARPEAATVHLWLRDGGEDSTVLACRGHLRTARLAGQPVQEHPVGAECEMPGTAWDRDRNVCIVDPQMCEDDEIRWHEQVSHLATP